MDTEHVSVLSVETIDLLAINPTGIYVDCTLGAGGHSSKILQALTTGHLYAFDQDQEAIDIATARLQQVSNHYTIIKANFAQLQEQLMARGVEKVDGILFDIGVSSMQLDREERGFSYRFDAPLDMRMNKEQLLSAFEVVNEYEESALVKILFTYGEEPFARKIARNIVKAREKSPIRTTFELIEIIKQSIPMKKQRIKHPAKQTFQAIRIEVNNELGVFESALRQAFSCLNPGGRIAVITFHSLEDRICKNIFNEYAKTKGPTNELEKLVAPLQDAPAKLVTKKPIVASEQEIADNRRAKSAKLRVIELRERGV